MNTTEEQTIPLPASTERDPDGRLVGLSIDSRHGSPAQDGNAWLVAADGSEHSNRAVAEAVNLARQMKDCALHLVNVQHWLGKEAAETELRHRGLAATEQARSLLDAAGKPWRLHVVMGEAAEGIVALATRLGCHGIIVGSRGLGATENLLLGSTAQKVIHLSPVPVLVVR
jgi:nucleotide-binding universal stress UspA family protein